MSEILKQMMPKQTKETEELRIKIFRIKKRIKCNQNRIEKWQKLLEELENSKPNLTNKKLMEEINGKIKEYEFKLRGIVEKRNRKTGEIILEKVGELFLRESLAIELENMERRLEFLEK